MKNKDKSKNRQVNNNVDLNLSNGNGAVTEKNMSSFVTHEKVDYKNEHLLRNGKNKINLPNKNLDEKNKNKTFSSNANEKNINSSNENVDENSKKDIPSLNDKSLNANNGKIKTEKQKKAEMLDADLSFGKKNFTQNIIIAFLVLMLSFFSVASVVISGNMTTSSVVISANETNTRIVQAKLAELGYFDGAIDGIFDEETINAIKSYQKDNNLTETGNLDQVTAAAIGVTDNTQANTDLYLLAKLIYSEARGEPYEGQVAVGAVVLNRVDDAGFPNTLQGVIYQPWAFTALHDGQFNLEPNGTAYQAAQDALNGWDPSYGCLYYYNPATATSSWIFSRQTIVVIGNHVFCI